MKQKNQGMEESKNKSLNLSDKEEVPSSTTPLTVPAPATSNVSNVLSYHLAM